jgi:peptidoglycan LD-endopeptidase LytH
MRTACVRTAPGGPHPVRAPEPRSAGEQVAQAGEMSTSALSSREAALTLLGARGLLLPVAGVDPARVPDSFDEARDGGARRHNAIDILAPRGTPVLAADDGVVLRVSTNRLGGKTIYATDPDRRLVYYYAHLDGYHPRLQAGMHIARGDTLGYVGTTGNAPANVPHLHFQVMLMSRDGRYWDGEPVNPYPVLVRSGG